MQQEVFCILVITYIRGLLPLNILLHWWPILIHRHHQIPKFVTPTMVWTSIPLNFIYRKWTVRSFYCLHCFMFLIEGTSLIVEWLNVKIQSRSGGTNPASNGNSDKNSYNVGEDTYQFQVWYFMLFNMLWPKMSIPLICFT